MFLSKRSLRKGLFGRTPIWGNHTSGGAGGQTGNSWSTSGIPLKSCDTTLHSRYVGCRCYQKWLPSRVLLFFLASQHEKMRNYAFFLRMLRDWKFLTWIFFGSGIIGTVRDSTFRIFMRHWQLIWSKLGFYFSSGTMLDIDVIFLWRTSYWSIEYKTYNI